MKQTLLEKSEGLKLWHLVVGFGAFFLLMWWLGWPRTWTKDEIRQVAREECAAMLDAGH